MTDTSYAAPAVAAAPRLRHGTIEAACGAVLVGLWLVAALGAGLLSPYDPNALDLAAILSPPGGAHWFGTDQLGRDVLSRVMHGRGSTSGWALPASWRRWPSGSRSAWSPAISAG